MYEEQRLDRPALRELQSVKLRHLIAEIIPGNPFWNEKLAAAGIEASAIRSVSELLDLPFVTKTQVAEDQRKSPPYGSNLTYPLERYVRLHETSGTTGEGMRWLDTPESWDWFMRCWAIIYDACGVRPGERFFFPFSFGPFIGFWAAFEAAQRLGHFCMAGGGMSSSARLRAIVEHGITVIGCTPTYALHLAQTAAAEGIDLAGSAVRALIVAGEPGGSLPSVRERIEDGFGARVFDHTGMTEIGALGTECCENPGHVHLIESECIAELIDPASGELLFSPGADCNELPEPVEGELVLTNLGRLGSPLIRYRTGDMVRLQTGRCPCGRHYVRMVGGIIGRSDDMLIIRGNNVYPSAIDSVIREVPGVAEYQVVIDETSGMTTVEIAMEPAEDVGDAEALARQLRQLIKDRLFFHATVTPVECGSLPRFELKARRFTRRR
ncbi:MAG: phenylacetate--CoA ligase family protein [Planctomycetes bacterium]|nr:phenylacetate--CoA ligase family protein [Planctomycetota bacterium]